VGTPLDIETSLKFSVRKQWVERDVTGKADLVILVDYLKRTSFSHQVKRL
jgi:hypothetical protein